MLASKPCRKWKWMSSTGPPHSSCEAADAREFKQAAAATAAPKNCLRFIDDSSRELRRDFTLLSFHNFRNRRGISSNVGKRVCSSAFRPMALSLDIKIKIGGAFGVRELVTALVIISGFCELWRREAQLAYRWSSSRNLKMITKAVTSSRTPKLRALSR